MSSYEIISWPEAASLYDFDNKVNSGCIPKEYLVDKLVAVYPGNLETDIIQYERTYFSDFDNRNIIGILVKGDLKIQQYADLRTADVGFGAHILVNGNFFASNLLISGMSELVVEKDTFVSDFVVGMDGSAGGLTCKGNLQTKHALFTKFRFKLIGSFDGVLYTSDETYLPQIEEDKLVRIIENGADLLCIYSEELENAIDDEDNEEEWERLTQKYTIFTKDLYGDHDIKQCLLDGEKVFRDIDVQLILDSNRD